MTKIWKFPLKFDDVQEITLPEGFKILSVQMQNDNLCMWARVETIKAVHMITKKIHIYGTGSNSDSTIHLDYLGTVQDSPFVWHIFMEKGNNEITSVLLQANT